MHYRLLLLARTLGNRVILRLAVEVGAVCERLGINEQVAGADLHRRDHHDRAAPGNALPAAASAGCRPRVAAFVTVVLAVVDWRAVGCGLPDQRRLGRRFAAGLATNINYMHKLHMT